MDEVRSSASNKFCARERKKKRGEMAAGTAGQLQSLFCANEKIMPLPRSSLLLWRFYILVDCGVVQHTTCTVPRGDREGWRRKLREVVKAVACDKGTRLADLLPLQCH